MKVLKKGFTLVELMVVIAIIGILATGAMTTYTSQTQKARDSNRISDVKIIQSAVEQYFQDNSAYPVGGTTNAFTGNIASYITGMIPQDPRFNSTACSTSGTTLQSCDYKYATGTLTEYEVTTAFEAKTNITAKAANTADGGNNGDKYEVGNALKAISVAGINVRR